MVGAKSSLFHLIGPNLYKKENVRQSTPKLKRRKRNVTFDSKQKHDIISHAESAWLRPEEYRSIRREIELTIVLLEQIPDGESVMRSPWLCSRGLEDFRRTESISTSTRSIAVRLKPEVFLRRRLVIDSVLNEQESQRRRGKRENDDVNLRSAGMLRINRENTMNAVERALRDAEQA